MLTLTGTLLAAKYRVGARLGAGGMGEVYEAVQEDLGRRVAVKVMSGPMASDPQLLERFQREARAVAALGHPHIVSVTDFQDNPGEPPFLVMERLFGESLGDLLERNPMVQPQRACRIAEQTLSALAAAHEAGLVHRDVKPDNIFLCKTDTGGEIVKLLDFGVAKAMEENKGKLTSTGAIVGTLVYMAPEQARGEPIDARADIYALGACLYHMLAGQTPFPTTTAARLLTQVCTEAPIPLASLRPDLDGGLLSIVSRAMAHDASHRYLSARAMMGALGAFMRGEPVTTDPMSATALAAPGSYATGPTTGPRYVPSAPPPSPYVHPGSGGGVVVPPYGIAPSSAPPAQQRSALGFVFGALMLLVAGGAIAGAAYYVKTTQHHDSAVAATQATATAPPPVELIGASNDVSTLSPLSSSPGPSAVPIATAQQQPQQITAQQQAAVSNTSLSGMNASELVGQMVKAHQAGDGRTCLDAYDKLRAQPTFSDPANGYAMMRGDCTMAAGRCEEGRKILRDYFNMPKPTLNQMSPQQIEMTVSSMAKTYCPASQLTAGERLERGQILLSRAESSKDITGAVRYADEMASQLPAAPRASDDDRRKVVSYEYLIGKAYGDAGRCDDARKHFHAQCSLNSSSNADNCARSLLNNTSGCKQP